MSTLTNDPESRNLSNEEISAFEGARAAAGVLVKNFDVWMAFARGVEVAKQRADRIGRRSAFQRILEQQGLSQSLGNTWGSQKSTANKLLAIYARKSEVERWRDGLSEFQRIHWSAPTTLYKHCPLFQSDADREAKEDKAELAKGDKDVAKARGEASINLVDPDERNRFEDEITTLKTRVQKLEAENMALRQELALAKGVKDPDHSDVVDAIAADMTERGEKLGDDPAADRKAHYAATDGMDDFITATRDKDRAAAAERKAEKKARKDKLDADFASIGLTYERAKEIKDLMRATKKTKKPRIAKVEA